MCNLPRDPQEIELARSRIDLVKQCVEVVRQVVLLTIAVAFAVVAIVCALGGDHWPALATGGSSGLAAAASAPWRRRGE